LVCHLYFLSFDVLVAIPLSEISKGKPVRGFC
jgi:hypothetical protein